jgi:hypothetical protein
MDRATLSFDAEVWLWRSKGASWHFLTVEGKAAAEVRYASLGLTRGFGSVSVEVMIGGTRWRTSLFPSKASGGFILPLKAAVRKAEGFAVGDRVAVTITI